MYRFAFNDSIDNADGVDLENFRVNGDEAVDISSYDTNTIDLDFDDDYGSGVPWSVTPPSGIEFDSGLDIAAAAGTVS